MLDVLKASHEHPNAEEVYLAVNSSFPISVWERYIATSIFWKRWARSSGFKQESAEIALMQ